MAQATSIIAAGTVIRGRIRAEGDLEIHGHVEGSVSGAASVTIGAEGLVKSDVDAESVIVSGAVAGNLRGTERVLLEDGARVVGDVSAPSIGIRPGAKLRGRVATGAGSSAPEAPRKPAVAAKPAVQASTAKSAQGSTVKRPPAAVAAPSPVPTKPSVAPVTRPAAAVAPRKVEPTVKRAPEPVVPVLQKRTKKAVKRRAR